MVEQLKQSFKQGFKRPCLVLPCGGGKSVILAHIAYGATHKKREVLFLVHRIELCEQIDETFRSFGVDMNYCNIQMVQSVTKHLDTTKRPDLILTDENHHSLARTYRNIYDFFDKTSCIGVTATPIRLNGSGLGDVNDDLIVGVTAKWLIENGFLAPYEYYAPTMIDVSKLSSSKGEYSTSDAESELDKPKIYGDVIKHYKKLANGKKAICYCATLKHSKSMVEEFNKAGIPAAHLDGSTPKDIRKQTIEDFRSGKITVLSNQDLISEGFDVPNCEVAILLRPTKSLTLYIQQSMRCMRFLPGKTAIIIDHVGNVFRHGFPDEDREWSLKPKRSKENAVAVKTCPECYRTHFPSPVCPYCGYIYGSDEKTRYEIEILEKEELQRIEEINKKKRQEVGMAKTYEELLEIQISRNYKNGWAAKQAQIKGIPIRRYREV